MEIVEVPAVEVKIIMEGIRTSKDFLHFPDFLDYDLRNDKSNIDGF